MSLIIPGEPLIDVPDRAVWLQPFFDWMHAGVHELSGLEQDDPLIVEMLARVHIPPEQRHDETPWCSASMNAAMSIAGLLGTGRANARSWEHWGIVEPQNNPRVGAVAVLWRGEANPAVDDHVHGHVANWMSWWPGDQMLLCGGNQGNRPSFALYPRRRLLTLRWPDKSCLLGD